MSDKKRREWYRTHHICPSCGQRDAVHDKVHCMECLEKFRIQKEKLREVPSYVENRKEYSRKRYAQHVAENICVRCGKRMAAPNRVQCEYCIAGRRAYGAKKRRESGIMPKDMFGWPGICSRCGRPTGSEDAHKLCPACLEQSRKAIVFASKQRTTPSYFHRVHSYYAFGH